MSEFKSSNFRNEDGSGGPDIVGLTTFTSPYYFVPPSGTTAERPSNPAPGMLRFNEDIGRLEVWRNDHWATILGESPNLGNQLVTNSAGGTGTRGVFAGGFKGHPSPALTNEIRYITVETLGTDQDFGDLSAARYSMGATGSRTRGIFAGGREPGFISDIHIITFASTGNSTDSGANLTDTQNPRACANQTRAVFGSTSGTSYRNTIEYVTIASLADAQDFGDLTDARGYGGAFSSSVRGFFMGGIDTNPPATLVDFIDYVTISTTGNGLDFGDMSAARLVFGAFSNSTRGIMGGGSPDNSGAINAIDFITLATTGNAQDFGDLSANRVAVTACASPTRGVFIGGEEKSPNTPVNTMEYVTIATTGNAQDFGDLEALKKEISGASNAHGGL